MAQRYGALTLQLKQLSDLSNIGSTYTNIFSASGKQVLSGVGSGSFSYPARDNTLHSAITSNIGQVAYIYQTDAVASGAAMDVCCIIIDGRNITTSPDGATVTVSGPDILDQLTYTNAGTGAIDDGAGGPSTTDLDDIMAFAAAGWGYTATGTGGATRSSTGSYHATKGDNVLQLLVATAKRSGDIFRLSSYSPPAKTVAWRASADSSGVTLRMPADPTDYDGSTTTGIILSMSEDLDASERITGVRPFGAGIGDGRLDITNIDSGDTGADPSGYSTTFASNVIVNSTLETALGYTKRIDVDFSDIGVEDGTNATQLVSAAVDLWREAINYLQERDGEKKFYRLRCIVPYDLRPGQTVAVNYTEYEGGTAGGSAVWTINASFTIHEVNNSVGQDGIRYTDLQIANTVKKQATPERVMAEAVRKTQATTRKSDIGTSPGSVSTGRTINATQPVRIDGTGAADLSADRTLSINGLSTVGTANQIPGTNAAGTAWEYKTLTEGTGITIGHSAGAVTITNSSPGSALAGLAYVTIGNTSSLSAERALTAGDGLDLTDGGANSTATLAVDVTDFIDTSFGLTESSNNIRVNLAATSGLSFSTGALQLDDSVAGAGLAISSKVLSVGAADTSLTVNANDIQVRLAATSGLQVSTGLMIADTVAGNGLTIASKVLAVGAGDGIDVAADSIAVDVTDFVGDGLVEVATNNIALGTPGSITSTSTNAVTASSHTHAIDSTIALSAVTITAGAGLTGGGNLTANRTIDIATADTSMTINADSIQVRLAATSGLQVSTGLMIADTIAGAGLTIASKVLAVGAGDGIDVAADSVAVDVTDLVGSGLVEEATNNLALGTPGSLTASSTNAVTTTSHTHAITSSAAVSSATAVILATDSSGRVQVQGLGVGAAASGTGVLDLANKIFINETTNTQMTYGITINQGSSVDHLFDGKNSAVAHGITDFAETDTFVGIEIFDAVEGGARAWGFSEGYTGFNLRGAGGAGDSTKSTAALGPVLLQGEVKSGTNTGSLSSGQNVVVVRNRGNAIAVFGGDGDLYLDTAVNTDSWDDYDDMALLNGFRATMVPDGHELRRRFGQFMDGARDVLERTGVVTFNKNGHHFVATKKLQMLTIDALRQKHERDTEIIEQMCRRIAALEAKYGT